MISISISVLVAIAIGLIGLFNIWRVMFFEANTLGDNGIGFLITMGISIVWIVFLALALMSGAWMGLWIL